jgi:hypothetical protein
MKLPTRAAKLIEAHRWGAVRLAEWITRVAVEDRQVLHLRAVETGAHLGAIGGQQRVGRSHLHHLSDGSDLELNVHAGRAVNADRDLLPHEPLEAGSFKFEDRHARCEMCLRIIARLIRLGLVLRTALDATNGN